MKPYQRTRLLLLVFLAELALWAGLQARQLYEKPSGPVTPVISAVRSKAPAAAVKAPTVTAAPATDLFQTVLAFPLEDQAALEKWDEKIFKGKTDYRVLTEGGKPYLKIVSNDAASGLFYEMREEADEKLYLSWRWRAHRFPPKREPNLLSARNQDDFAARVYVIFVAPNLFRSDCIEYIWDDTIPAETVAESPYSDRIQLYVIRSGAAGTGEDGWRSEERNILEDYRKLFKKEPSRAVGAVALMSDSDNTQTASEADFADLVLKRKK